MRSVEAEGGTIDEAIANALSMLRAAREQVEIDILANATRGVLGFGGKPARVRATVRESLGSPVSRGAREMRAQEILAEILRHMGVDCTVERRPDPEPGIVALAVHGSDSGLVIGRHGQTLDALEYVLNRIVARGDQMRGWWCGIMRPSVVARTSGALPLSDVDRPRALTTAAFWLIEFALPSLDTGTAAGGTDGLP